MQKSCLAVCNGGDFCVDVAGPDTSSALLVLVFALLLGIIKKEQKVLKLKVEGTYLGKIGTLMDEKGTKTFCKE